MEEKQSAEFRKFINSITDEKVTSAKTVFNPEIYVGTVLSLGQVIGA